MGEKAGYLVSTRTGNESLGGVRSKAFHCGSNASGNFTVERVTGHRAQAPPSQLSDKWNRTETNDPAGP